MTCQGRVIPRSKSSGGSGSPSTMCASSSAFTIGCSSGVSRTRTYHTTPPTDRAPRTPRTTSASHSAAVRTVISGAVTAAPTPTPGEDPPVGYTAFFSKESRPPRAGWMQGFMRRSPIPSRKRTPIRTARSPLIDRGIEAVSAVNTPHDHSARKDSPRAEAVGQPPAGAGTVHSRARMR